MTYVTTCAQEKGHVRQPRAGSFEGGVKRASLRGGDYMISV